MYLQLIGATYVSERQFWLLLDMNWNCGNTCKFAYIYNTQDTVMETKHLETLTKAEGMFGEDSNHLLPTADGEKRKSNVYSPACPSTEGKDLLLRYMSLLELQWAFFIHVPANKH